MEDGMEDLGNDNATDRDATEEAEANFERLEFDRYKK